MKRLIPLLVLLAYSNLSQATIVSIQAHDYEFGTPITSDYVTLTSIDTYEVLPVYRSSDLIPVFTEIASGAPTGYTTNMTLSGIQFGLLFEFTDPVEWLDVNVINTYRPSLWADTFAFAEDGSSISVPHQYAEAFTVSTLHYDFGGETVKRFYIGGGDQIGLMYFTGLSFNVPEPGTMALFALGLGITLLAPTRRKASGC